jgi:hypothetical protein
MAKNHPMDFLGKNGRAAVICGRRDPHSGEGSFRTSGGEDREFGLQPFRGRKVKPPAETPSPRRRLPAPHHPSSRIGNLSCGGTRSSHRPSLRSSFPKGLRPRPRRRSVVRGGVSGDPIPRSIAPVQRRDGPVHRFVTPGHWRVAPGHFSVVPVQSPVEPGRRLVEPGHRSSTPGHWAVAPGHRFFALGHRSDVPVHWHVAPGHCFTVPGQRLVVPVHRLVVPGHRRVAPVHPSLVPVHRPAAPVP